MFVSQNLLPVKMAGRSFGRKQNYGLTVTVSSEECTTTTLILGFFGGKKKFDPEKSYETFYRENVPEKPLQTHHDKLFERHDDGDIPIILSVSRKRVNLGPTNFLFFLSEGI